MLKGVDKNKFPKDFKATIKLDTQEVLKDLKESIKRNIKVVVKAGGNNGIKKEV